jgi:hypothetical protein
MGNCGDSLQNLQSRSSFELREGLGRNLLPSFWMAMVIRFPRLGLLRPQPMTGGKSEEMMEFSGMRTTLVHSTISIIVFDTEEAAGCDLSS